MAVILYKTNDKAEGEKKQKKNGTNTISPKKYVIT